MSAAAARRVDPILLEVVRRYEQSVNEEMARTIINLSGSPIFVGASDFACACVDADGELLNAICFQLPMAYAISNSVRAALDVYGENVHPGDMIFTNDSFVAGGIHPSDCVVITPVFAEGRRVMWVGTVGHVTDVGGVTFGSFPVQRIECFGEAVRFTPVKVYERGEVRDDIVNAFLTNVRIPTRTEADLRAMMGANWVGRERMSSFIGRYGADLVETLHESVLQLGEDETRQRIASLPDGEYRGATYMEHDGEEDLLYPVRCKLVKDGSDLLVDYSGSAPQAPGVLNCPEVATRGAVMAALATMLVPDLPFTEGVLRPIVVDAPAGSVVNAQKPAPISAASTCGTRFATDAMIEALNYLIAGAPASAHRQNGPWSTWTWSLVSCRNQRGEPWIFTEFLAGAGGSSALPFRDGYPVMGGIQYIDSRIPNIEELELLNPILVVARRFWMDSGGVGKYRGGVGLEGIAIPHDTDGWTLTSHQNRRTAPAFGASGGHPGGGSCIAYSRGGGRAILEAWSEGRYPDLEALPLELAPTRVTGVRLSPEDAYYSHSTSGQGYGDPLDRDPSAVLTDVRRGWVSARRAREAYAVVLASDGSGVDEIGTAEAREAVRRGRLALPFAVLRGGR